MKQELIQRHPMMTITCRNLKVNYEPSSTLEQIFKWDEIDEVSDILAVRYLYVLFYLHTF